MNKRIIKSMMAKKFGAWVKSIQDESLQRLVRKNSIITGGAIASLLLGEQVNDYDLYFTNYETALAVVEYYVNIYNTNTSSKVGVETTNDKRIRIFVRSDGIAKGDTDEINSEEVVKKIDAALRCDIKDKTKYQLKYMTSNAITLTDDIQLVTRFYGDADQIHENFDFVHATSYWTSDGNLVLRSEAMESLLAKELRYVGSKYPVCSLMRIRKFLRRGFTINAGQMLKIIFQASLLDLTNPEVLKEQLIGVDVAYFNSLITALSVEGTDAVEQGYLVQLIDEIFE